MAIGRCSSAGGGWLRDATYNVLRFFSAVFSSPGAVSGQIDRGCLTTFPQCPGAARYCASILVSSSVSFFQKRVDWLLCFSYTVVD